MLRKGLAADIFGGCGDILSFHLLLVLCCGLLASQKAGSTLPVGTVIPSITCDANPNQTYALYLPSNISPKRNWPIIFVFDPGARGQLAVETVRAAAEKYGYIVAASNNSHNGPLGGFAEAAQAMWRDTQTKLPVDRTSAIHRGHVWGCASGNQNRTSLQGLHGRSHRQCCKFHGADRTSSGHEICLLRRGGKCGF